MNFFKLKKPVFIRVWIDQKLANCQNRIKSMTPLNLIQSHLRAYLFCYNYITMYVLFDVRIKVSLKREINGCMEERFFWLKKYKKSMCVLNNPSISSVCKTFILFNSIYWQKVYWYVLCIMIFKSSLFWTWLKLGIN